jgi:hypothetical protein
MQCEEKAQKTYNITMKDPDKDNNSLHKPQMILMRRATTVKVTMVRSLRV